MNADVNISGKPVRIEWSQAASDAMQQRITPLLAEMELYFSCLVRKKVRFYDSSAIIDSEQIAVTDSLVVRFRPVVTQSCSIGEFEGDEPPVTDFPIANPVAFIPHWLRIDFQAGQWSGEFGYL